MMIPHQQNDYCTTKINYNNDNNNDNNNADNSNSNSAYHNVLEEVEACTINVQHKI